MAFIFHQVYEFLNGEGTMPIYAYQCRDCGHRSDELQKISAPPLTDCPSCGHASYGKLLTAPSFQLKGSGWYATDFKNGGSNTKPADATTATPAATPVAAPAASEAAAPAAASSHTHGAGCGSSCAS